MSIRFLFSNKLILKLSFSDIVQAKALYDYTASNTDELSFKEGEILDIVDGIEDVNEEWWKAQKDGLVYIVPKSYLELEG